MIFEAMHGPLLPLVPPLPLCEAVAFAGVDDDV